MKGLVYVICLCLTGFSLSNIVGQTLVVDDDGPADFTLIQPAIDSAQSGDTILVMPGTYHENILMPCKSVTLKSNAPQSPELFVIDGMDSGTVISFINTGQMGIIVEGFTIVNGNADRGGGVLCSNSSPTVTNCVITQNTGVDGGGVLCENTSSPHFIGCSFTTNTASYGGAVNSIDSSPILESCILQSNSSTDTGGAVRVSGGQGLYLTDCVFVSNSSAYGGAMDCRSVELTLTNCLFEGNSSPNGGGVYIWRSTGTFSDCEFIGNNSINCGGGLFAIESSPVLRNCNFRSNSAQSIGGGIFGLVDTDIELYGCTFYQNSASSAGGVGLTTGSNAVLGNCIFTANNGHNGPGAVDAKLESGLSIINCVFNSNVSGAKGALSVDNGKFEMTGCTIYANSCSGESGISFYNCPISPVITHTILWSNGNEQINAVNAQPDVKYCCIEGGYSGSGNISKDPELVDVNGPDRLPGTMDDDLRLGADSPCIDAGNNCLVPPDLFDLDGDGVLEKEPLAVDCGNCCRLVDNKSIEDTGYGYFPGAAVVDIGAYEYQVSCLVGDLNYDGVVNSIDLAIMNSNWLKRQ